MSQDADERASERFFAIQPAPFSKAKAQLDALDLLDDARLRQALGYLEDCAADEIWQPLRAWIADRDDVLARAGAR